MSEAKHLRWDDLTEDSPMPLLRRRRVIGEQAMISRVLLQKGCIVPTHAHPNEQFACIMSGRARFGIGEENSKERKEITASAGDVVHLPGNVPHSCTAIEDTLIFDVFSPPSATTGIDRPTKR